jgi:hypothetical protein
MIGCTSLVHSQDYSKENTFLRVEMDSSRENPRIFTIKVKNISTSKVCLFDAKYPTAAKYVDTTLMDVDFTLNFLTDPYIAGNKELGLLFLNPGESFTRQITGETKFKSFKRVFIEIEFFVQKEITQRRLLKIFRKEPKTIFFKKYGPMREEYVNFFFWKMDT